MPRNAKGDRKSRVASHHPVITLQDMERMIATRAAEMRDPDDDPATSVLVDDAQLTKLPSCQYWSVLEAIEVAARQRLNTEEV